MDAGAPLVKATLLTGQDTIPNVEPPTTRPVQGNPLTLVKTAIQQAEQPPQPFQPPATQPALNPEVELPADQPPESQDRSWQLLKKIFRKHQEQTTGPQVEQQQDTTTKPDLGHQTNQTSLPPSKISPSEPPVAQLSRPDGSGPVLEPPVGQASTPAARHQFPETPVGRVSTSYPQGVLAVPEPVFEPPVGQASTLYPQGVPARPDQMLQPPIGQVSTSYPQGAPAGSDPVLEPPTAQVNNPAQPGTIPPKQLEQFPSPGKTAQTYPEHADLGSPSSPQPATPAQPSDPKPPELQALPIDAIWPVQKRDFPQPVPLSDPGPEPINFQPQTDPHTPPQDEVAEIHLPYAIARVPTGQPTRSQVEVIATRRPRPASQESFLPSRAHHSRSAMPKDTLHPQDIIQPDSDSQSSVEPADRLSTPETGRLYANTSADHPSSTPRTTSNQPTFKPSHGTDNTPPDSLVPTDIGPLPVDLWHLLNQPQPASNHPSQAAVPTPPQSGISSTPAPPLEGPAEPISKGNSLPVSSLQTHPGNLVQTSPDRGDSTAGSATDRATTQNSEQTETPQRSEPLLDLDELANRVYLDIKRKLAVEWERSRHRG